MKIKIYNEPQGGSIGGCEVCVAVLAEGLALEHEVEIVHYRPTMTRDLLADFAAVDLSRIRLVLGPSLESQAGALWGVMSRYRREKEQEALLSGDCDAFISFNHEFPVFCAAPRGILNVLFPLRSPESMPRSKTGSNPIGALQLSLQRCWHRWKVKSRLKDYQTVLSISAFTQRWTKERWGVDSHVLFPPVEVKVAAERAKEPRILSVGRFAVGGGHGKKQLEMLDAFARLKQNGSLGWAYDCVGACGSSEAEIAFLARAYQLGLKHGAAVRANLDRKQLLELYQTASIFWHAAGMDVDERQQPELAEHFGIATVEAMAFGCVPVVINKGAQPEIVEHGVCGFLWDTVEELQEYTSRLQNDDELRGRLSAAARARAQKFSREKFVSYFRDILSRAA